MLKLFRIRILPVAFSFCPMLALVKSQAQSSCAIDAAYRLNTVANFRVSDAFAPFLSRASPNTG
jgi:hypothetical protein